MTNEEFIEQFHEKVSMLEVILDHGIILKRISSQPYWRGYCPFCEEQPLSFLPLRTIRKAAFFRTNTKLQTFHCNQCKVSGDVIEFIRNFYKLDQQESRFYLSGKYDDRFKND
jgi:DNA primase